MVYELQFQEKKYDSKKVKTSRSGFPWIFKEPKNCDRQFPLNSGHKTEQLFSMRFEIVERDQNQVTGTVTQLFPA